MPQFMIEKNLQTGENTIITGSDAHHIIDVLRLGVGDWIVLSDGKGGRFRGEIAESDKKSVTIKITEKISEFEPTKLILAQAVVKNDNIESIIQKAIQLGVTEIIPFVSERTIPKYSKERSGKKIERWNKIAIESSKQCGLSVKPVIRDLVTLEELLKNSNEYENKIIFYEGEESQRLENYFNSREDSNLSTKALKHLSTIITIGPEGGFSPKEIELATKNGFETLNLGPLIMRVETAAVSAITLTQHYLGHFGSR